MKLEFVQLHLVVQNMPLSLPGDNEVELLVLAAVFDEELEVLG